MDAYSTSLTIKKKSIAFHWCHMISIFFFGLGFWGGGVQGKNKLYNLGARFIKTETWRLNCVFIHLTRVRDLWTSLFSFGSFMRKTHSVSIFHKHCNIDHYNIRKYATTEQNENILFNQKEKCIPNYIAIKFLLHF